MTKPFNEFRIRDARAHDLGEVLALGRRLNTINLPAERSALEEVISHSESSFSQKIADPEKRQFLFVLTDPDDRVIGTSQVIAKHGTLDQPHIYFEVGKDERYSSTLNLYFRHQVLRIGFDYDGPTEIGSLILEPGYRSHPAKLGRMLSFVRFLWISMHRHEFADRILAELLPQFGPGAYSGFWEAVGRKFTNMDYSTADAISRKNKEFIKSLFPHDTIDVSLLSKEVQEGIGKVGEQSSHAAHLLSKIGFRYSHKVDPFDGGPHFEACQAEIELLKHAKTGVLNGASSHSGETTSFGIVGIHRPDAPSGQRFLAMEARYDYSKDTELIFLNDETRRAFSVSSGERIHCVDIL